ncbi:hypothetical protein BJF92_05080 [Rhizobium rhizosphaerae]|uniref:Uncharacterized protein n=1 Tax=Xaviernesmea rhizosphaerae TaxID=1672749 RepID=A0A1Q9AEZ3_9HYPH|nr:hypothetical protein BJF92_05080 [Xaviernesmea rhizosphaerae]
MIEIGKSEQDFKREPCTLSDSSLWNMSRGNGQRFCDHDMRQNKDLKCGKRIREIATRFSSV